MIATWVAGEATASAAMAAVTTMIERATSGASVRHMTSTAWATTATAASLSPRTQPASVRSADSVSSAKATRMIADGRVNPEPGEDAAEPSGPKRSDRDPELAAGRTGERLAEREEVGEARLVEPPAALDVLAAEVGDVGDRPAEGRQAEAEGCAEDLGQRGTVLDARCQIAPTPDTCRAIHRPIMIANSPAAIVAIRRTSRAT